NGMKFMVMSYETAEQFAARKNEQKDAYWVSWRSYFQAMEDAKVLAYGGNILQEPETARTIYADGEQIQTADGSLVDDAKQVSGYWVIDVPSWKEAEAWARRSPAIHGGAIELRPIFER
ncbi:MAG TPA: YciI family protein, partial [Bacillales bacterium]|nr:YciI family protein [Bacillales bacterium]